MRPSSESVVLACFNTKRAVMDETEKLRKTIRLRSGTGFRRRLYGGLGCIRSVVPDQMSDYSSASNEIRTAINSREGNDGSFEKIKQIFPSTQTKLTFTTLPASAERLSLGE